MFVATRRFDHDLLIGAQKAQALRAAADYDAHAVSPEQAPTTLADADRFVSAISAMLDAS